MNFRSRSSQTVGRQVRFGRVSIDQRRRNSGAGDPHERRFPGRSTAGGTRGFLREWRPLATKLRERAQEYP
jgi:hypothetical protein